MQEEPSIQVKFSEFLAKEMIEEGERIKNNAGVDGAEEAEAAGDANVALQRLVDKTKQDFEREQDNFNLEEFEREQQALVGRLMQKRAKDMLQSIAEAQKRD